MKFRIVLACIICSILLKCEKKLYAQETNPNIKEFDLQNFEKYKVNGTANYMLKDSTQVSIIDLNDHYLEIDHKPKCPFNNRYTYYKASRNLKSSECLFYDCTIGEFTEYDENGKVLVKKDFDKMYQISIQSLIEKVHKDFNIDLSVKLNNKISVKRYIDEKSKLPEYAIMIFTGGRSYRYILIDGNTGEVKKDLMGHGIE